MEFKLDQILQASWIQIWKDLGLKQEVPRVDIGIFQLKISNFKDSWTWYLSLKWKKKTLKKLKKDLEAHIKVHEKYLAKVAGGGGGGGAEKEG